MRLKKIIFDTGDGDLYGDTGKQLDAFCTRLQEAFPKAQFHPFGTQSGIVVLTPELSKAEALEIATEILEFTFQ